ncbi:uncharacterized protein LOC114254917 [Monomorium pharaonis]|uniref:uncharacterized protein LOC114254917 n=1 Tax=Monomorium pharaonis TaxID=307658 RepID=UPI001745EA72|nr:uncharacterized protein LOC114254917 [Monomorium pharaonis]
MAFGLTQWLISFTIFLAVLIIITWSAIHLSKKSQNSTDISLRFLDVDYPIEWKNKSFHSTIVNTSTSRVIESTDGSTLFANDQGSEITDSSEFYKILQTFYSTKSSAFHNVNNTATKAFASSAAGNDSTWNNDTTIMLSNTSEKIFVLNDHQHINEKVMLSNHISQTVHSTHLTHEEKLSNINKSSESDLSQSIGTEHTEFPRDERNGISYSL